SGESKDPRAQLKPLASKRMASIYQQAWALIIFMPTLYPYWGEGVKEAKSSKGLLDFLFKKNE
ncbi:MAG: hypothetical protein HY815_01325, partial [Candidatus Riflebacteria bacterium]|nr:hypothetical protein [Candidatus Riflebacteria bacterium]